MPAKTALDALNESLASNGVATPDVETPDEELEVETPDEEEVETPEGGESDEEVADEETPDDDVGDETDEEAEGDEEDDAAETPEAKATREAAEKIAARTPPDHLNDPIPEGLNKRTQERVRFLADTVKTLQPEADFGREIKKYIDASGMSGEEFSMALTFGKLKNSDSVEDHRKAYQILWSGLKELAPLIGETLPGVDPLEGHADLQARVTAKTLDPKDAAEIAAGRNRTKATQTAAQRAQQNAQAAGNRAQQTQQLEAEVRTELNALGAQLSDQDPQFEAKIAIIKKKDANGVSIASKIANTPPGLRVNAFLKAFLAVKVPPKVAKPVKTVQQPMRAGKVPAAGGNGVRREPKSAVEAMDFALGLK